MRRIFSFGLLIALSIGVSGCQDGFQKFRTNLQAAYNVYEKVSTGTVSAEQINVVANGFNIAKGAATGYLEYCAKDKAAAICDPGTKADPGPLRRVIRYIRVGTNARNQLEPYILTGGAGPGDVFNTLVDAVNGLNAQPISQAPSAAR